MLGRVINPWTWQEGPGFVQGRALPGPVETLYCAGQLACDADGAALYPGDMKKQLLAALDNLETVLRQSGYSLGDIVRLNSYVTDMHSYFEAQAPFKARLDAAGAKYAATLLGVTRLALPEAMVEIEATAVRPQ